MPPDCFRRPHGGDAWAVGLVTARQMASGRGRPVRASLVAVLERPWGLREVGVALAVILLADLALGYVTVPDDLREPHTLKSKQASAIISRVAEGVLDESAHAATALVLLKAVGRGGAGLTLPTLAGAVLIDVDHLPMELGLDMVTRGTNRPYSHSLLTIATVAGVAVLLGRRPRRPVLAVAYGIATHLLRDMATGGVPLYWPVLPNREMLAYGVYVAIVLAGGMLAVWAGRRRR